MWPRSFHPSVDGREDEVAKFARAWHKALERLGSTSLSKLSSLLPGLKFLETTQRRLDAAHPGALKLMTQANQGESEFVRLVKQHSARSGLAAQYSAAVSVCEKACSSPLAMLGSREIEALKDRHTGKQITFKPQHSLALFSEERAETRLRKGVNSLADISRAVMGGYIIHPHATQETA